MAGRHEQYENAVLCICLKRRSRNLRVSEVVPFFRLSVLMLLYRFKNEEMTVCYSMTLFCKLRSSHSFIPPISTLFPVFFFILHVMVLCRTAEVKKMMFLALMS